MTWIRPLTKEDLEQMYLEEHLTSQQVSDRTGVPITTIGRWKKEWGILTIKRHESFVQKRFGKLLVLRESRDGGRGVPTFCHCRCDCGKELSVTRGNLQQGFTNSCGCSRWVPDGWSGFHKLLSGYIATALKRNLSFVLTTDQVAEITQETCHYCGCSPQQIRRDRSARSVYKYNGIDRVDSSLGYTIDNVVAACGDCNRGKSTQPLDGFLKWACSIHKPDFDGHNITVDGNPRLRSLFYTYRSKAKLRKIPFDISELQAAKMFVSNCAYCGAPPNNGNQSDPYTGIDRLDSNAGYSEHNCVPACFLCNRAKRDRGLAEFLAWAESVRSYQMTSISNR